MPVQLYYWYRHRCTSRTTWNNCSGVQLEYQVLYSSTVVPGKAKPCGPLKSLPRSARVACRGSWLRAIGVVGEMHTVPSVRCSKIDTHETYVDIVGFSPEYRVQSKWHYWSTTSTWYRSWYNCIPTKHYQVAFWHSFLIAAHCITLRYKRILRDCIMHLDGSPHCPISTPFSLFPYTDPS